MSSNNGRRLAIMKDVGIGVRDVGRPVMFFSTYISESVAALQILSLEQAYALLNQAQVYDVKDLEGKPCWVEEGNGMIKFLEYAKI